MSGVCRGAGAFGRPTGPAARRPGRSYSTGASVRGRETGSWTPARRARRVHERHRLGANIEISAGGLERRRPMLLFRLSGVLLLRFAERTFLGLLFHAPPRITRWPPFGPSP